MNIYDKLGLKDLNIDENKFRDKSRTSLSLGTKDSTDPLKFLREKFIDEENYDYFELKFLQAISGDGNELKKMDAVKSSSLCALLFFYNIKDEDGHRLTINDITYTKSYFEYKNKVFRNPSNIDVVLTNDDGDILFVECKFSEYLEHDKVRIAPIYFSDHKSKNIMERMLNNILFESKDNRYVAKYNGNRIYATGLKQIVAHYVGINHFINKDFVDYNYNDSRDDIKKINNPRVRFIEVLFDLGNDMADYRDASDYLIEKIIDSPNIYMKSVTYQELFEKNITFNLDHNVMLFYKYKRNGGTV